MQLFLVQFESNFVLFKFFVFEEVDFLREVSKIFEISTNISANVFVHVVFLRMYVRLCVQFKLLLNNFFSIWFDN